MNHQHQFSILPVKASSIIGAKVINPEGDSLGEIKEMVIDPKCGRIAYAVVSFGGFLGMGPKLFAIPFNALDYSVQNREYVLNVSKERLEAAPGFDRDHWPSIDDEQLNRDIYTADQRLPYWELASVAF